MRRLIFSFVLFASLAGASCTGINVLGYEINSANTHPAPEYANPFLPLGKGGLIFHKNTVAGQIGSNAENAKSGRACSNAVLWLVAWGDSSIEKAKEENKISKVLSVDHEVLAILGILYHRHCTVITGS